MMTNAGRAPQLSSFGLVDVHSHILPGVDDGPEHRADAAEMLRYAYHQGARHMWATPHFYPKREPPEVFLHRRELSIERLNSQWDGSCMPHVYAAAEVAYFFGLGRAACAKDLCLEGTPYILVEMPEEPWAPEVVEDLLLLRIFQGLKPILVHVERCLFEQKKAVVQRLSDEGVLFQCNAAYLADYDNNKREIKSLLRADRLDLIGSDCHNMRSRKPGMDRAIRQLQEVMEEDALRRILRRAADITKMAVPCC